jgi:nucleoside-diphosphate-sugar epimerase
VKLLLERGDRVRILARGHYPALAQMGVECLRGDVGDRATVQTAVEGMDVVFHAAAKAGIWGRPADYQRTNVEGTRNVIAACREKQVRRLVYTSTPSVVTGEASLEGVDESYPYSAAPLCEYQRTKIIAEKEVLRANSACGLLTTALRPHNIWGPGDPHFIPRLARRSRSGRLRRIGDGTNKVDVTYIDNAAQAHVLAADRLQAGSPIAGQAYFLGQEAPLLLWPFLDLMLEGLGLPRVARSLPYGAARALGLALEWAYGAFSLPGEPPMTRFLAAQLGKSHYFSLRRARAELEYSPAVTIQEGLERTFAYYKTRPLH